MPETQQNGALTTRAILFRVLLVVFLVGLVNELFAFFGPLSQYTVFGFYHFVESISMVAVCGPILWVVIARPLREYAEKFKRAEVERNRVLSLMRSTLESTVDGIIVIDLEKRIMVHNSQYVKMWGISDELLTADDAVWRCNDAIRAQLMDSEEHDGHICHLFTNPETVYRDVLTLKDGRIIERVCTPQSIDGHVTGRVVNYRDVTERLAAQIALSESESRFRQIFENSLDAILLFDVACTTLLDCNQVALKMFRYEKKELLNGNLDFLFTAAECRMLARQIVESNNELGYWVDVMRAGRKDGTEMYISVRCRQITLAGHGVLLCTIRDISERVRTEEQARSIETKLIQANKMTSLGVLVAGIAHEINNPNNYIMLNSELLTKAWKDAVPILYDYHNMNGDFMLGGVSFATMQHEIPELLDDISDGSRRIRTIVNGLKNFAREGKLGMQNDLEINQLIQQATTIISHQIRRHTHKFSIESDTEIPPLVGNPQQIEQVLINLIMNALQSLPKPECGVRVTSRYDRLGGMVCVDVADEGCGIPESITDKILEPFFTTRIEQGGTGLGLSISQSILKDHNGTLFFNSSPVGTTFTVCFPVAAQQRDAGAQTARRLADDR